MLKTFEIAKLIDHSLLRPDATVSEIERLCDEAMRFGFHSVCVNPFFVSSAKDLVGRADVKVTTAIGFPLGMTFTNVKVYEAIEGVLNGADELDIVMNIGMAKSGQWNALRKDISDVISATRETLHKIIIETCYLSREEKIKAVEVVFDSGAAFVKTSTGFCAGGATTEDITLIKAVIGNGLGIKASGGIKTLDQVKEFIDAGATRIGTSHGVAIMEEFIRVSS